MTDQPILGHLDEADRAALRAEIIERVSHPRRRRKQDPALRAAGMLCALSREMINLIGATDVADFVAGMDLLAAPPRPRNPLTTVRSAHAALGALIAAMERVP